ncbi:MAG: hypothetical protein GXY03_14725 [Solirubrobacterales bacterium]|nr:hypothetical protein [Solirubrobacterales bacterium]
MTKTIRQLLLPAAIVVLALLAPALATASPLDVQRDCADSDVFERTHSRADLKRALGQIQADLGEYGTCGQMIRAELARLNRERGGGGGGGPTAEAADLDGDGVISPEEEAAARMGGGGSKPGDGDLPPKGQVGLVHDGGDRDGDSDDDAGTVAATSGGGGGGSLPLILAIVALALAAIGGGLWYAGKRNPAVGNALRRVPIPFRNS